MRGRDTQVNEPYRMANSDASLLLATTYLTQPRHVLNCVAERPVRRHPAMLHLQQKSASTVTGMLYDPLVTMSGMVGVLRLAEQRTRMGRAHGSSLLALDARLRRISGAGELQDGPDPTQSGGPGYGLLAPHRALQFFRFQT
jgi:hypothetical protein